MTVLEVTINTGLTIGAFTDLMTTSLLSFYLRQHRSDFGRLVSLLRLELSDVLTHAFAVLGELLAC